MGTEKPFLHFNVDPELLKKLDDFRYKNRFPSRATPLNWLFGRHPESAAGAEGGGVE